MKKIICLFTIVEILIFGSISMAQKKITPDQAVDIKVPKTYLDFWNIKSSIRSNNNCYNYSTNRLTNDFAQPGDASRNIYTDLTCDDVQKSAASDLGLEPTSFFEYTNENDFTLIALVVAPDEDFHWYRRDSNKMWSHKPGSDRATTLDNSGQPITSPETADRGPYTEFCGYFKIKNLPKSTHQQNAGQVRIGNMKNLPSAVKPKISNLDPNKSYIEFKKYSGRRNPRIYLDQIIVAAPQLKLHQKIKKFSQLETFKPEKSVKLGEQRFILNDIQGVIANKNTVLNITSFLTAEEIQELQKLFMDAQKK
jgi:hypothetical protein